ncbi:Oidioi.mRNA.OKI2018_I69.chr1.g1851.t1.cds [Oikopleura dioica]|uniref:Oidioi.mRNA.OKI2018_I69.chr1.g1851.t1.cds n=1 Tax=Oikopleura dioica TaxID=34765 RepID=A0ABN7STF6_OIKDI|nr:Oidioi.mRNA.OKI2018_I69.chr1.g1851.t1.cds [Oikopleura dioica]
MIIVDAFPVPYSSFVTSYGTYGKCEDCEKPVHSTAKINGKRICAVCKKRNHPNFDLEAEAKREPIPKFVDSDAAFKCPAKRCSAKKLSFCEFYVGSCCSTALNREVSEVEENEECLLMHKIYQKSRRDVVSSYDKWLDADRAYSRAELNEKNARKALEKAEKEIADAAEKFTTEKTKHDEAIKWQSKVQKRLFLTVKAVTEGVISDTEPAKKKSKRAEVNEKLQCKVCSSPFDVEHPEAILASCGHRACTNCLMKLEEKECPAVGCGARFSEDKIIKVLD